MTAAPSPAAVARDASPRSGALPLAAPSPERALLSRALDLHPSVAVRPEPFGALLYHFGTRRLSFLKDPRLLALVQELPRSATVGDACVAVGLPPDRLDPYVRALEVLVRTDMLVPRTPAPHDPAGEPP